MNGRVIAVPYFKDITGRENWLKESERKYFMSRLHLYVRKFQTGSKVKTGEIVSAISSPTGVRTVEEVKLKYTESLMDVNKMIETLVNEIDLYASLEAKTGVGIKAGLFDGSSEIKSSFSSRIRDTCTTTTEHQVASFREIVREKTVTKEFIPERYEKIYFVKIYKKVRYEIYLSSLDFLFVEYFRSPFGIRRRRVKSPDYKAGRPANVRSIGVPLFSIEA